MSVIYDDSAPSILDASPRGHFKEPDPPPADFTVTFYSDGPGPEYWICVVKVLAIDGSSLKLDIMRTSGHWADNPIDVDVDDIREVWRGIPSTLNPVAGQDPLEAGLCVVLCLSEEVVARAGLNSERENFAKHPWAGGATLVNAIKEMALRLKKEIAAGKLPATSAAKAQYPQLFQ